MKESLQNSIILRINEILFIFLSIYVTTFTKSFSNNNEIIYSKSDKHYYFIVNSTFCKIDRTNDRKTINYFGFSDKNVKLISDISVSNFVINEQLRCPIKNVEFNPSCDYINYKKYLLLLNEYHTNHMKIINSISNIGSFFNPAITSFYDNLLLFKRNAPPNIMIGDKKFRNFNSLNYNTTKDFEYLSDYRIIHVPFEKKGTGCIYIVFTYEKYYTFTVIPGFRMFIYNINTNSYNLLEPVMLNYNSGARKEKNWTPFWYYNELFFIQRFVPFHVVKFENNITYIKQFGYKHLKFQNVTTVSKDNEHSINWNFGDIRGGTSALNIHGYGFLGFFHSLHCSTYVFGAYIFSNTIPFHILKLSNAPIVTDKLIYNHEFGVKNLSIVFPLSYLVEDKFGNDITSNNITSKPYKILLTVGYNDTEAMIIRLDFNNLIESLSNISQ